LVVESPFPLPAFASVERHPDVRIRVEKGLVGNGQRLETSLSLNPVEYVLSVADVGVFSLRNGQDIVVRSAPEADEPTLSRFLTGSVMALLLHQRGLLAIHASCVIVDGNAALLLGEPGLGKSSLAAALHSRGHSVLSDDLTAIRLGEDGPTVLSTCARLKLYPAIADFLNYDRSLRTCLSCEETGKDGFRVETRLPSRPPVLKLIYTLSRACAGVVRLPAQQAFLNLIQNSYPTRLLQPGGVGHFRLCAQLAGQVPVFRLRTFDTLNQLLETALAIETDVRERRAR
jgi:hypothetical protein